MGVFLAFPGIVRLQGFQSSFCLDILEEPVSKAAQIRKYNRRGQDRTRQGSTGQDTTGQDRTGGDRAGQGPKRPIGLAF